MDEQNVLVLCFCKLNATETTLYSYLKYAASGENWSCNREIEEQGN